MKAKEITKYILSEYNRIEKENKKIAKESLKKGEKIETKDPGKILLEKLEFHFEMEFKSLSRIRNIKKDLSFFALISELSHKWNRVAKSVNPKVPVISHGGFLNYMEKKRPKVIKYYYEYLKLKNKEQ